MVAQCSTSTGKANEFRNVRYAIVLDDLKVSGKEPGGDVSISSVDVTLAKF